MHWPLAALLLVLVYLFSYPNHCGFLFCCCCHYSAHHYFLALKDAPGPCCIFPDPDLESGISNKLQMLWKIVLNTKTWMLGVHGATGVSWLLTLPLGRMRKYESMLLHIYTHTYKCYKYEVILHLSKLNMSPSYVSKFHPLP